MSNLWTGGGILLLFLGLLLAAGCTSSTGGGVPATTTPSLMNNSTTMPSVTPTATTLAPTATPTSNATAAEMALLETIASADEEVEACVNLSNYAMEAGSNSNDYAQSARAGKELADECRSWNKTITSMPASAVVGNYKREYLFYLGDMADAGDDAETGLTYMDEGRTSTAKPYLDEVVTHLNDAKAHHENAYSNLTVVKERLGI